MAVDAAAPRSRRALLAAAAGAAAATVVAAVERPLPVAAVDGDIVHQGDTLYGTAPTSFITESGYALEAINSGGDPPLICSGPNGAVLGMTSGYAPAVVGEGGEHGVGVHGGSGSATGVQGWSTSGIGVEANGGTGTGLRASATGTALDVVGKAKFSRSGRVLMARGRYYVDVDLRTKGGLAGTPLCFATLMTYRAGFSVAAVRPNWPTTGKFRIYLTRALTSSTYIAWVVLG